MVFKRSKPGVIGRAATTVARTALITATATKVAGKTAPRAGAALAADPTPPATPVEVGPRATGLTDEAIAKIQKLAEMNKAGILTDEEFATQKARLLG
jgi:Short C-terminal domain